MVIACSTTSGFGVSKDALLLIGGWLLGIVSSLFVPWVQKLYKGSVLKQTINTEVRHLRHRMALGAIEASAKSGLLNKSFIEPMRSALLDPHGIEDIGSNREIVTQLLDGDENVLLHYSEGKDKNKPLHFPEEAVYFIDSQMAEIGLLSIKVQERISRLKRQIDFFNDGSCFIDKMVDRTFEPGLSDVNHARAMAAANARISAMAKLQSEVVQTCNAIISELAS